MRLDVISETNGSLRCAGGREMQVETQLLCHPAHHLGCLVASIVVEHQVHLTRRWHGSVNAAQEMLGPVARQALTDHHAGLDVERREQLGRAMVLVLVGHRDGASLLQLRPGCVRSSA